MNSIRLKDFGIVPDTDITLALYSLMKEYTTDTEFIFENGDYYLSPFEEMKAEYNLSNSIAVAERTLGVWMKNMKNCVLSGNGAKLYYSGQMQAITIDHCENILVKDLVIDWKKPLVAEGLIVNATDEYADVYIDQKIFPHRVTDNWIEFDTGADEWYPLIKKSGIIRYDANKCVCRNTGDDFILKDMEILGNSTYRLYPFKKAKVNVGELCILRHNSRIHAGLFAEKSSDITVENVTFHSCGGLGCLAQFCHNLTYRKVHFLPNTNVGRMVSNGRDDGMHITCNSGTVNITECTFLGLMDDPVNVHSCCVTSDNCPDNKTLKCSYGHEQACGFKYWAEPGDKIVFIERKHMSQIGSATVASYTLDDPMNFTLCFNEELPEQVIALAQSQNMLALDNETHTSALNCTKNHFGSCRARGVLVSTPQPVLIEDNIFESSGSAILVAGDSNYWFESGECHDVVIKNNVFTGACLSSMYEFCNGIISISPVVIEPETDKPFHKNIHISKNIFETADTPVLYAFSCENLTFKNNHIFKSFRSEKWHPKDNIINLSFCRNVDLSDNYYIGNFNIDLNHTQNACKDVIPQ